MINHYKDRQDLGIIELVKIIWPAPIVCLALWAITSFAFAVLA